MSPKKKGRKKKDIRLAGDPITVGGGGGRFSIFADYDVDLTFDDTIYTSPDDDGSYSRANYKITKLQLQDYEGNVLVDLTSLLPADGDCNLLLKFNHGYERIYIQGNPITVSFEDEVYPKANGQRKRRTHGDRIEMKLGTGRWGELEIRYPRPNWRIVVESGPV